MIEMMIGLHVGAKTKSLGKGFIDWSGLEWIGMDWNEMSWINR